MWCIKYDETGTFNPGWFSAGFNVRYGTVKADGATFAVNVAPAVAECGLSEQQVTMAATNEAIQDALAFNPIGSHMTARRSQARRR